MTNLSMLSDANVVNYLLYSLYSCCLHVFTTATPIEVMTGTPQPLSDGALHLI